MSSSTFVEKKSEPVLTTDHVITSRKRNATSILNIPNTAFFATSYINEKIIQFKFCDEKLSICGDVPTSSHPWSMCINPQGHLVCATWSPANATLRFEYWDISELTSCKTPNDTFQIKTIKSPETEVKIEKHHWRPDLFVILPDSTFVFAQRHTFSIYFLKPGATETHALNLDSNFTIRNLILSPNKELLAVLDKGIQHVDLDQIHSKPIFSILPIKKFITCEDLGISGTINSAHFLSTGELALNCTISYLNKFFGKTYVVDLYHPLPETTLREVNILDDTPTSILSQTCDGRLVLCEFPYIKIHEYDLLLQHKVSDVQAALMRFLTKDTTGIVTSYLQTQRLFKPALALTVSADAKLDPSKPHPLSS